MKIKVSDHALTIFDCCIILTLVASIAVKHSLLILNITGRQNRWKLKVLVNLIPNACMLINFRLIKSNAVILVIDSIILTFFPLVNFLLAIVIID